MNIALIGCMVMNREISYLVSKSNNIIRTWWLRQGLHDTPNILRSELQKKIDEIEEENENLPDRTKFDAICLAYGLCSNGVIGLKSRSLTIVIPRCDDCISLFLGSADRYRELFEKIPGVYWYNTGWIEQAFTPSKKNYEIQRLQFAEEYGEENADYLMECTNNWMTNYKNACFITCPLGDSADNEQYAKDACVDFGWQFNKVDGKLQYMSSLVNGEWEDDRFFTCPSHSLIEADFSNRKFKAIPQKHSDKI